MPSKSIYQPLYEFMAAMPIAFGAIFCIFPSEGLFFKWWEDHTFLVMLTCLGLGLLFFFFNAKRLMIVSFGACAALCLLLQARTQTLLKHSEKTSNAVVKVAQFSLTGVDTYFDENLHAILDTKADLISLQAVQLDKLERLHDFFTCCGYPFYECVTDEVHQKAMVVYARRPFLFLADTTQHAVPGILGKIELELDDNLQEFFFFSAALQPVVDDRSYAQLRERLHTFGYQLNHIKSPLLAFGDYQVVPWSKDLQIFKNYAHLNDSRRSVALTSAHGHFPLLNYPFDHIFYSNHFKCLNFETISSVSTPHLGILGTYEFKTNEPTINVKNAAQKSKIRI